MADGRRPAETFLGGPASSSGSELAGRLGRMELLRCVEGGQVRAVVTTRLDRWLRSAHSEPCTPSMNRRFPLEINADEDGPTEKQRQAYLSFKQAEKSLRPDLQVALFEFYKIEREDYADICSDIEGYVEECLPVLHSSEEVWSLLTPLSCLITGPETDGEQYGQAGGHCDMMLSWHGCWDVEHEFSAIFEDGTFLGIEHLGCFYEPNDLRHLSE